MGDSTFVILARHGEAAMPDEHGRYARNDAPLTDRGIEQVRSFTRRLDGVDVSMVYTSDVPRAVHSANLVASEFGYQPVVVPELREIEVGDFEGITLERVRAEFPDFRPWLECSFFGRFPSTDFHHRANLRFPGGESVQDMLDRAKPAFLDIVRRERGRVVALVTHAWLNQALLCHIVGAPVDEFYRFAGRNASLTFVEVDDTGKGILYLLNGNSQIEEVAGDRLPMRESLA